MPDDTGSIDAVMRGLYATISGPAGPRDWDRFRALFTISGKLLRVTAGGPRATANEMGVEDFVKIAGDNLARAPFFEVEIARRAVEFGHIAHVFSTYEARLEPEGAPFARGINSVQLFLDGHIWQIVSLMWDQESPERPIPAEYLQTTT